MRRAVLAVAVALVLVGSQAGCSSDGDEGADEPSTTSSPAEADAPPEDMAELAARALWDEMSGRFVEAGIDADPEATIACFAEGLRAERSLLAADYDALPPGDPAEAALLGLMLGCLPDGAFADAFVGGMAQGGAPPEAQDCAREQLAPLSLEEQVALFQALSEGDQAALQAAIGPCLPG